MKIIRFSPYITSEPDYTKNTTGFGRSVWDIAKNWYNLDMQKVIIYSKRSKKINDKLEIIGINIFKIYKLLNIKYMVMAIKIIIKYHKKSFQMDNLKVYLKLILSFCSINELKKMIVAEKPDAIYIHGISYESLAFIQASFEINTPVFVNLHGIISLTNPKYCFKSNLEIDSLKYLIERKCNISFISTGIKFAYENEFNIDFSKTNTKIVVNGANVLRQNKLISEKERMYKLKNLVGENFDYFLLSVGSITVDKGQHRIIKSLKKLPKNILEKTKLLVIGDGPNLKNCMELVSQLNIERNVSFLGYIENNKLSEYYMCSTLLAQVSKGPGFSRMYFEAMSFGTPAIACKLQPGILDIYNPSFMILSKDFSSYEISQAILQVIKKSWDREKISYIPNEYSWKSRSNLYREFITNILDKEYNKNSF